MIRPQFHPDGMHMIIHTGHRTFDRHCDLVTTGNVISTVQYSSYIRPIHETCCNAQAFPAGQLTAFDLKPFGRLPAGIQDVLAAVIPTQPVILYQFHHPRSPGRRLIDGYVVTDVHHHFLAMVATNPRGGRRILETVAPYVSDWMPPGESAQGGVA